MNIETIAVCGAGTMGRGIAQVCATAGFRTILFDPAAQVLQGAQQSLLASLQTLAAKGKISAADATVIHNLIFFTGNINDCNADLVIEAIVEESGAKAGLFVHLAALNSPETIYTSNTSSLSISALAAAVPHRDRFAGLHFFNPAPLMKLVEVVQGRETDLQVVQQLEALVGRLGKTAVVCADRPGFIVNRVARPFYIEALRQAESGVDLNSIDRLMEARGFKMGPFRLMDLIGNDVNYAVSCSVWQQLQRPDRLRPSLLQQQKVEAGELGKKTGRGYYQYEAA